MLTPTLVPAAADSARAVAQVYTASLAVLLPALVAAFAALMLRRTPAGTRALVWRAAVATLLIVFIGRMAPLHWIAWVLPGSLAAPLVTLGRVRVAWDSTVALQHASADASASSAMIEAVFVVYLLGVMLVLLRLMTAWLGVRRLARGAHTNVDAKLARYFDSAKHALGITRPVELRVARRVSPMTTGVLSPVVLLPREARGWDDATMRAVLLHELSHVRARDALFALASRLMCALYWFHPAAWWIDSRLHRELELACDDRVLGAGVRPSEYADVLVRAADRRHTLPAARDVAMAAARRRGLRERLAAIVDVRREYAGPRRGSVVAAGALVLALALPLSTVRLAPTRQVLATLMRDTRWESRAYAVLDLAQRADTVAVARRAAVRDPSPHVRAWARYALSR